MTSYNEKRLRKAGRNIALPFCLFLDGSDDVLHCERSLRVIPGRRSVLSGKWGRKQVVAKLFYRRLHVHRHLRREAKGIRALSKASIISPDLLYVGKARNTAVGVLLLEYIHPASHLGEVWNNLENPEEKRDLLCRFVAILAKMHQAGLKQQDLHLNNFLVKSHTIYCVDAATIQRNRRGHPLRVQESVDNLALFFAQLTFQDSSLVFSLFTSYAATRGWNDTDNLFKELQLRIEQWRRWRIKKYLNKIFRESIDIVCRKSFTRYMLCKRSCHTPAMAAFLDNPDPLLDKQNYLLLKRGNTSTVGRVKVADHDLVVKRYNIKNFWHGLRRSFMATRAAHSWRNAHLLLLSGIATPKPIALLERRLGPFRGKAYFISEYVEGLHAVDFFGSGDECQKSAVARRIAQIFSKLELARITHGDMKATNIIIHEKEPILTDLDAMRLHLDGKRFASAHSKDKKRFSKNWIPVPEVARLFEGLID